MAPKKNYAPEQMERAVAAVRNGEKVAVAAKQFGVPRITLLNKVTGKTPIGCAMGPSTILTKSEEDILVRWILALCEKHFPIPRDSLLDSVQKIIIESKRQNPFTNNRPGKKWFQSFMKRHPELVEKVPENLTKARDDVTEQGIRNWFLEVKNYLNEKSLQHIVKDPRRVFNTDESAFFLSPKPGRVLAKKGENHLYSSCGDEKDNLTVLFTGNAAGELAPPMIVFNYERIPSNIVSSVPDGWGIGKSDSGWMCGSTFYEYITNIFNPWLEATDIEKPVLFFLDGHRSHLTLHLSNFCSENGIEVIALYPNSTHILQPMDLSVFRPLKVAWRKAINEWKINNLGRTMRKENFAPVLQKAVQQISKECIKNGFRAGGLYPFGPDYIDFSKIKHPTQTALNQDPAQKDFLKYLESEIVKHFSLQKLDLFNKLYYENRSTMEDSLPNEDTTLYVIWAKNKAENTFLEPTTSNARLQVGAQTNIVFNVASELCIEDNLTQEMSSLSPATSKPLSEYQLNPAAVTEPISPLVSEFALSAQPETQTHGNLHMSDTSQNVDVSKSPSVLNEITPTLESIENRTETSTPAKNNNISEVLGYKVPTPFKKNLFWPEEDSKKKKRITKEKIPSAVTSKAFKDYYQKKEIEKRKQQEEKEERARQRQEKKILKQKTAEEKKNKLNLKSKRQKVTRKESTSDDTDMEVEYAESDESIETDTENLPSNAFIKKTNQREGIIKGCYVIVKYGSEYFPGKVENTQGRQYEVSTMTLSTGQTFRWPDKPDKIWYRDNQVIEKINEPICLNNRGFYKVREMEKYLPDIYNI